MFIAKTFVVGMGHTENRGRVHLFRDERIQRGEE